MREEEGNQTIQFMWNHPVQAVHQFYFQLPVGAACEQFNCLEV